MGLLPHQLPNSLLKALLIVVALKLARGFLELVELGAFVGHASAIALNGGVRDQSDSNSKTSPLAQASDSERHNGSE